MKYLFGFFAAIFAAGLASMFFGSAARAEGPPRTYPGPYWADVVNVYDGDTMNVIVHVAPGQMVTAGLRVEGVDTPELSRSGCKSETKKNHELKLGAQAKIFVQQRYKPGQRIRLLDLQQDKFGGRLVAIVERKTVTGWQRLDDELLRRGLADPYGSRKPIDPLTKTKSWCAGQ